MFTGLVEAVGTLRSVQRRGQDITLEIDTGLDFSADRLGDSVAVNGVCLTMTARSGNVMTALASAETVDRTNLGELKTGSRVNVERALTLSTRLGGHLVLGHVDTVAAIVSRRNVGESIRYRIALAPEFARYVIEKGSITVDGTSLTVNELDERSFEVNIIPHTAQSTSLTLRGAGDRVNLEFDVLGKYVEKLLNNKNSSRLEDLLKNQGFI